jgi:hypothetical protein
MQQQLIKEISKQLRFVKVCFRCDFSLYINIIYENKTLTVLNRV